MLDTNLLIALLWPPHMQHEPALKWFSRNRAKGWATCPMTQAGFVRIVSNPAFSRDAVSPWEAVSVLRANTEGDDHQFWPDDASLPDAASFFGLRLVGHQQVTDAYLLALAIRREGVLVTFDGSVAVLLEPKSPNTKFIEVLRQ